MRTIGFDVSALDANFKAHAHRGIGRYVRELQRFFDSAPPPATAQDIQITEFSHRSLLHSSRISRAIEYLPCGRQTARQQLLYPLVLTKGSLSSAQALHFPAHLDAPSWCPTPTIVTVLDLIPLVLKDLYKADRPNWRFTLGRWLECRAIRQAKLIIAISKNTAQDVHHILGIPKERIVVTPLGVDPQFSSLKELSPDQQLVLRREIALPDNAPFILSVGGIDQRKNWKGLLATFAQLISHERSLNAPIPYLVMAGRISDDAQYPKLLSCIKEHDLSSHVLLPGYIPDEKLLSLYGICSVFYFPSLYEGFGLTPLEALAAGAPVVSSNRSSMPEVLEGAAELVDPDDIEASVRALHQILHTDKPKEYFRERGRRHAKTYTWERTGIATLEAYAQALMQR